MGGVGKQERRKNKWGRAQKNGEGSSLTCPGRQTRGRTLSLTFSRALRGKARTQCAAAPPNGSRAESLRVTATSSRGDTARIFYGPARKKESARDGGKEGPAGQLRCRRTSGAWLLLVNLAGSVQVQRKRYEPMYRGVSRCRYRLPLTV